MAIQMGGKPGAEICKILGVPPGQCRKVSIVFEPNSIVRAEVEMFVETEQMAKIESLVIDLNRGESCESTS